MISTVAVGTDGSATATEAVKVAAEMARRFDARLVLVSAFEDKGARGGDVDERQWAFNSAARLQELLKRAEEDLRREGVECSTLVGEGDPAEVLIGLAGQCGADVLVIGNRGMERRVLGSVPNTVSHRAPCSVLVVKTT
jgi:nucleotide-binding universal stress UspA family protein